MRKIFVTASAICLMISAKAQFTHDYIKAADEYFRKADYYSAAQYYEKYLSASSEKDGEYDPYVVKASPAKEKTSAGSKQSAIYQLAESYRRLNYYVKAEPYYSQAVSFDKATFPLAWYHYGTTLRALEKFTEAEKAFQQFLAEQPANNSYTEAANRELQNLRYIQSELTKKDLNQYQVVASNAFSAEGASYAPVWVDPATVYFTTTRRETKATKKEHLNKVYKAVFTGNAFDAPVKVNLPHPADAHQGGIAVSADGNTLYVTRWSVGKTQKSAGIYVSRKNEQGWSEPVPVKGLSSNGMFNDKQPAVMPDGALLFASDRAGGLGGFDLWMAQLNTAGEATNITNLGDMINTAFDEEAPYFHAPSETLVFSTNGRVGMGGFDLFFSTRQNKVWSEPQNFGYPVNSIKNDMYFASRGGARNILADVLISSDRAAACCLQLFAISKQQNLKRIAGQVVDCKTKEVLASVTVDAKSTDNQSVYAGTTSTKGAYQFTVETFQPLQIQASLNGYRPSSINTGMPQETEAQNLTVPVICLNKIPVVGSVEVLDNVYFAFNKAIVLEESYASLDKLVQMLQENPNVAVEIGGHTDNKGDHAYNQKLSEARAQSIVDYLAEKGIDKSRLVAKGYGETMPVAPNTNADGSDFPEGREKNRRTEFKVIKN